MQSYSSVGDRLTLDLYPLFGLERLMEPIGIATAKCKAAREFVYDDDLAVLDYVFLVSLVDDISSEGVLDEVDQAIYIEQAVEKYLRITDQPVRGEVSS